MRVARSCAGNSEHCRHFGKIPYTYIDTRLGDLAALNGTDKVLAKVSVLARSMMVVTDLDITYVVPEFIFWSPGIVISSPAFTAGAPECVAHQSSHRYKSLGHGNTCLRPTRHDI